MTVSAIYEGHIRHRRFSPRPHHFNHRIFMALVDLDEVEPLFRRLWLTSTRGLAPVKLLRSDYGGDPERSLADSARDLVAAHTGDRPTGPVRLLTHLRTFGVSFNPVSFFYCYRGDGSGLQAIVAEVHNTPWNERFHYVLPEPEERHRGIAEHQLTKAFHVSPFLDMDMSYTWKLSQPDDEIFVHMENYREEAKLFDATLTLERRAAVSDRSLASALLRHPLMPVRVLLFIYVHAAVLWWKRTPFISHPKHQEIKDRPRG